MDRTKYTLVYIVINNYSRKNKILYTNLTLDVPAYWGKLKTPKVIKDISEYCRSLSCDKCFMCARASKLRKFSFCGLRKILNPINNNYLC